jgi:hypothetical protein
LPAAHYVRYWEWYLREPYSWEKGLEKGLVEAQEVELMKWAEQGKSWQKWGQELYRK